MNEQRFIIIDAPALLHRAWHALPKLTDKKGRLVNAVYGFILILLKLIRELRPTHVAACFDTAAPTFRHQAYKEYKATRVKQPQEFYDQIPIAKEILQVFNIPILEKAGYEADDFIGSLKKMADKKPEVNKLIVTGDLDALQLVDNQTQVYFLHRGISDVKIYDGKQIEDRYNLKPRQLVDFKALAGDPSDNVPGIRGIGKKTAQELIKKFNNLENIYQYLEETKNKDHGEIKESTKKLLLEQREQVFLSRYLVTIKLDILSAEDNLDKYRFKDIDLERVKDKFKELDFQSLIKRLEKNQLLQQNSLF